MRAIALPLSSESSVSAKKEDAVCVQWTSAMLANQRTHHGCDPPLVSSIETTLDLDEPVPGAFVGPPPHIPRLGWKLRQDVGIAAEARSDLGGGAEGAIAGVFAFALIGEVQAPAAPIKPVAAALIELHGASIAATDKVRLRPAE
jgi:hypothetical protein